MKEQSYSEKDVTLGFSDDGRTLYEVEYKDMTEYVVPEGVWIIDRYAFHNCNKLRRVVISASVRRVDARAFNDCSSLMEIAVDENNIRFTSRDGVLYNKNLTKLVKYPSSRGGKTYKMPDGVTQICEWAFAYSSLQQILLSESVLNIGRCAFYECEFLKELVVPKGVTKLLEGTFAKCANLARVDLCEGLQEIESCVFLLCSELKDVELPSTLKRIGDSTFEMCEKLTDVEIPKGVRILEFSTFSGCSSLKKVTLSDGLVEIGSEAFSGCKKLKYIEIPHTIERVGRGVFAECESLNIVRSRISDPEGIFEDNAFEEVNEDLLVIIPNNTTEQYRNNPAFDIIGCFVEESDYLRSDTHFDSDNPDGMVSTEDCKFLFFSDDNLLCNSQTQEVAFIPFGEEYVPIWEFQEYSKLKRIDVDENNLEYESHDGVLYTKNLETLLCFPQSKEVDMFVLPKKTQRVGEEAFYHCRSLRGVKLCEGVKSIGMDAFIGCNELECVDIPSSVKELAYRLFSGCPNLQKIYLRHSSPVGIEIDSDAFCEVDFDKIILYVDSGALLEYHKHRVFGQFSNIRPFPTEDE